tara:strand:+ start:2455 stop:2676 length:222 start_codon:yes stop_codon:yes gene_type:complete
MEHAKTKTARVVQTLPYLDPQIVKFLKEKLPPIEYNENQMTPSDEFFAKAVYRAGQREVITRLEKLVKDQEAR